MADKDVTAPASAGPGPSPLAQGGNRSGDETNAAKAPGWYPVRTNPNEQTYWDGSEWAGRRLWSAGTGWTEVGADQRTAAPNTAAAAQAARLSANPYAPHPTATSPSPRPAPGVTLGLLLLIGSAVAMMVGSVTTWISSSASLAAPLGGASGVPSISATTSGVDAGISSLIGINGYITLIVAVLILVFAGLLAVSDDPSVRVVACVGALANLGLSIYAVVRLIQKIDAHPLHATTVNVGWGVILVLAASVLATLMTLFEVTKEQITAGPGRAGDHQDPRGAPVVAGCVTMRCG